MILEVLRILKDVLSSGGSTPLATQLSAIPRDGGDSVPTAPTIVDASRSFDAAVGRAPSTLPALTIAFDESVDMSPLSTQGIRDASVAVLFRYIDKDANSASAARDALYTMRALLRCINRLPFPITRNQIAIYTCDDLRFLSLKTVIEDQWCVVGVRAVFSVRDTAP